MVAGEWRPCFHFKEILTLLLLMG